MSESSPYGFGPPTIVRPPTPAAGALILSTDEYSASYTYSLNSGMDPAGQDRRWTPSVVFANTETPDTISHVFTTISQPGTSGMTMPAAATYSAPFSAEEWATIAAGTYDVYLRLVLEWWISEDGSYSGMSATTESYATPFRVTVPDNWTPPPEYTGGTGVAKQYLVAAARMSLWISEG